jgi:cell division protein FtsI (penicillin-binding protein 3)
MSATPRQVTRAYATLAGGGEGIVKPTTAARVSTLLEGVVSSQYGTGTKARIAGTRVAGKTGSVEWTTSGGTRKTYASFVGYVPAESPRYVIFVGVESPKGEDAWGGEVAAPVFSRIAARALAR